MLQMSRSAATFETKNNVSAISNCYVTEMIPVGLINFCFETTLFDGLISTRDAYNEAQNNEPQCIAFSACGGENPHLGANMKLPGHDRCPRHCRHTNRIDARYVMVCITQLINYLSQAGTSGRPNTEPNVRALGSTVLTGWADIMCVILHFGISCV